MNDFVFIVGAKRTPFGSFLGTLKNVSNTQLTIGCSKPAIEQAGVKPDVIDHVIVGNVVQSGSDAIYLPRHVGLHCKIPKEVPALGINRLCGSGFEAWIQGANLIKLSEADVVLACGSEQMSQIPYVVKGARFGVKMGNFEVEDMLTSSLTDQYVGDQMAITAETLAERFSLTRKEVDEYAYLSQMRYKKAFEDGVFEKEISPITVKQKKEIVLKEDEHPRGDTTLEGLSALRPLFKEGGVVTAGNSSGIVDGACSTILVSKNALNKYNLKPMAKIVGFAQVGCDPKVMGIGPVPAMKKALNLANLTFKDMDLIEVNEAFSAQFLAVQKELDLDMEITNINGGAIAVGHPLGATGVRIMNHLVYELERKDREFAIGSACIGGGQGIAIIVKRA